MKIYYFGELIADTKTENNINDSAVRARIEALYETEELVGIDLSKDVYEPLLPARQLALI
ncbi:hypothetical protein KC960_02550 [Candidatus Saccharibacteria bacterium]|nr:hypothetical protein [Candidatus Saccharibacteria bacterium]